MKGTWNDLVRMVVPKASDRDCHNLLWSCSCFPVGRPSQVLHSLRKCWTAGGGTVDGAIRHSMDELDAAMEGREASES
jgi:muramidase (phage lysozyme)